jgi:hypothetical protein
MGIGVNIGNDGLAAMFESKKNIPSEQLAADDAFWKQIRSHYLLKPSISILRMGIIISCPNPFWKNILLIFVRLITRGPIICALFSMIIRSASQQNLP